MVSVDWLVSWGQLVQKEIEEELEALVAWDRWVKTDQEVHKDHREAVESVVLKGRRDEMAPKVFRATLELRVVEDAPGFQELRAKMRKWR